MLILGLSTTSGIITVCEVLFGYPSLPSEPSLVDQFVCSSQLLSKRASVELPVQVNVWAFTILTIPNKSVKKTILYIFMGEIYEL